MVITGMPWLSIAAPDLSPEAEADTELDYDGGGGPSDSLYCLFHARTFLAQLFAK